MIALLFSAILIEDIPGSVQVRRSTGHNGDNAVPGFYFTAYGDSRIIYYGLHLTGNAVAILRRKDLRRISGEWTQEK